MLFIQIDDNIGAHFLDKNLEISKKAENTQNMKSWISNDFMIYTKVEIEYSENENKKMQMCMSTKVKIRIAWK